MSTERTNYLEARLQLDLDLLVSPLEMQRMPPRELLTLREELSERREQMMESSQLYAPVSIVFDCVERVIALRRSNATRRMLETQCQLLYQLHADILRDTRITLSNLIHGARTTFPPEDRVRLTPNQVRCRTRRLIEQDEEEQVVPTSQPPVREFQTRYVALWDQEPEEHPAFNRRRDLHLPIPEEVTPMPSDEDYDLPVNLPPLPVVHDPPPTYDQAQEHFLMETSTERFEHPNTTGFSQEIVRPPPYDPIRIDVDQMDISPDGSVSLKGVKILVPPNTMPESVQGQLISAISQIFAERLEGQQQGWDSQPGSSRRPTTFSNSSDESSSE